MSETINTSAPHITLALPAYNEESNIQKVLDESVAALEASGKPWELIVIDNCSSDSTPAKVNEYSSREPRVRLIRHDTNRLYSGSCATALRESRGQYIAIMDSDGQFTARDIPRFIEKLQAGANLVIGWRRQRNDPFTRLLISSIFNQMGKWMLGYPLHDLNCGIRMFDVKFQKAAEIRHRINMANPELFVRARRHNMKLGEVEIHHYARHGGVTSHNFRKLFNIFATVYKHFSALRAELKGR